MKSSEIVSTQLSTTLPNDYAEFLDITGYLPLANLGIEVYGYQKGFDIQKIPCVVAATRLNQDMYKLGRSEIVISHTGFEELLTVLDTETGKVSELGFHGIRKEVAESFSEWLSGMIKKNDVCV